MRERFFTGKELKAIGNVLNEAETTATELPGVIAAVRLLALTGCRLGEILSLKWEDHVDFEKAILRLDEAKAGARLVPIGAPALKVLSELPRSGPWVVHGSDPSKPLSRSILEKAWVRICERAKLENARLHDFRHTVGTYGGQAGFNALVIHDVLGHKTLAMTGRYVERDMDPTRIAVDQVAGRVDAALRGEKAEVVRLADRDGARK